MKLTLKEQTCHLLPERAVFWEEKKILILADIHFGKATSFRKQGIPIPEGNMEEDLMKMQSLIHKMKPESCIIVGDLIHAQKGLSKDVQDLFSEWLKNIPCEMHLILGNHDRSLAKSLPQNWFLHVHEKSLLIDPFYFCHFPEIHEPWFVWSGHLHPKIELKDHRDRLLLHCFQIYPNLGILPAFSSFVGGTYIKKSKEYSIYVIADTSVMQVQTEANLKKSTFTPEE